LSLPPHLAPPTSTGLSFVIGEEEGQEEEEEEESDVVEGRSAGEADPTVSTRTRRARVRAMWRTTASISHHSVKGPDASKAADSSFFARRGCECSPN
jgi:hypothetical protein